MYTRFVKKKRSFPIDSSARFLVSIMNSTIPMTGLSIPRMIEHAEQKDKKVSKTERQQIFLTNSPRFPSPVPEKSPRVIKHSEYLRAKSRKSEPNVSADWKLNQNANHDPLQSHDSHFEKYLTEVEKDHQLLLQAMHELSCELGNGEISSENCQKCLARKRANTEISFTPIETISPNYIEKKEPIEKPTTPVQTHARSNSVISLDTTSNPYPYSKFQNYTYTLVKNLAEKKSNIKETVDRIRRKKHTIRLRSCFFPDHYFYLSFLIFPTHSFYVISKYSNESSFLNPVTRCTSMESLIGFTGAGYVLIAADTAAVRSVVKFKDTENKLYEAEDKLFGITGVFENESSLDLVLCLMKKSVR